ncbi:MAG: hypothetical protein JW803_08130 [Endomicrobiales bacterium]|nr:hypothetical protein [Endomicrobiales bacterium]
MKKYSYVLKTVVYILAISYLLSAISIVYAEVPNEITYTGRLREYGQPASGTKTMCFKIFDASSAGNQVWTSGNQSVTISNGVFTYKLQPTGVDWRVKDYWLETIISDKILSPREKLTSQVYALHSKTAEDIERSNGTIHFSIGTSTYASLSTDGGLETAYGFFHDRGPVTTVDYTQADLTIDGSYYDLSLSTVPSGAKAVLLRVIVKNTEAGRYIQFQNKYGMSNLNNISEIYTQAPDAYIGNDVIVPCNADRKIQCRVENSGTWTIQIVIKGWWK